MAPQTKTSLWALPPDKVTASLFDDGRPSKGDMVAIKDGMATVSISGPLFDTDYATIGAELKLIEDDPTVERVVYVINSPGGMVAGCQECADAIAALAARKPSCAFTNSMMCSAAYWLGSATGRVYATETAEVGSIGVVMATADYSEYERQSGVKVNVIASGAMKAAGNPHEPLDDATREYFQAQVDAIAAVFKRDVAARMHLDIEATDVWAEGRVFIGAQALDVHLITDLAGGLIDAAEKIQGGTPMDKKNAAAEPKKAEPVLEAPKAEEPTAKDYLALFASFMTDAQKASAESFIAAAEKSGMTLAQMVAMAPLTAVKAVAEPKAEHAKAEPAADPLAEKKKQALDALIASCNAVAAEPKTQKTMRDILMDAVEKR